MISHYCYLQIKSFYYYDKFLFIMDEILLFISQSFRSINPDFMT